MSEELQAFFDYPALWPCIYIELFLRIYRLLDFLRYRPARLDQSESDIRLSGCMYANHPPFQRTSLQKMWESIELSFGGQLVSRISEEFKQQAVQTIIEYNFGEFFY